MPNASSREDIKARHSLESLRRGIGEPDSWQEKFGVPGPMGPVGAGGIAGASYMMASAPAGGQTYTAAQLGKT